MADKTNKDLELAYEFVLQSNRHVYLTGKAGTGKTTFLHNLKKMSPKRIVVAAPTGVAAINAGGVTLHSLFQLPFGPILPSENGKTNENLASIKFRSDKISLLKSIDLLVIDEISMVRPDILDAIDTILRRFRNRNKLFGGVQLLMIGDLYQLPPVIKDNEWSILSRYYDTVYFFSSIAYKMANPVKIELKKVYRQSNIDFIELLEKVRNNGMSDDVINALNSRYVPDLNVEKMDGYVILTTHNSQAEAINNEKMAAMPTKSKIYEAVIEGIFPEYNFPTFLNLELKIGAQVMFVKNDETFEKRFYNGKLGVVSALRNDEIDVFCEEDNSLITMSRLQWDNVKYSLNENEKTIEEEVLGSFQQFPLKPAWAITIHKSQGLTFDKVIVDAHSAFAHGQVYVALSRCRSMDGLILKSQITYSSVKVDNVINSFSKQLLANEPSEEDLMKSKFDSQTLQLLEFFNFSQLNRLFTDLHLKLSSSMENLVGEQAKYVEELRDKIEKEIFNVYPSFLNQLKHLFQSEYLPENNSDLKIRLCAAAKYFDDKFSNVLYDFTKNFDIDTDSIELEKDVNHLVEEIQKYVFVRMSGFNFLKKDYKSLSLLQKITNADLDFKFAKNRIEKNVATQIVSANPILYDELRRWRNSISEDFDKNRYAVVSNKILVAIADTLPTSSEALSKIKGMGKKRTEMYGKIILNMVCNYMRENNIQLDDSYSLLSTELNSAVTKKSKKEHTNTEKKLSSPEISYKLFQELNSIDKVAKERGLEVSTIAKHLEPYVESGQISIFDLVDKNKIEYVKRYLVDNKIESLKQLKEGLGNDYSYQELKFIMLMMN